MPTENILSHSRLQDAYRRLRDRIDNAAVNSGRQGRDVAMVAVTKYAMPDQIRTLVEMGHEDLGENRVQQLMQRVVQLQEFLDRRKTLGGAVPNKGTPMPKQVRWHMVGHLQRNKVKQVAPLVNLIHSIDSLRLAEELHALGASQDRTINILIQVNASGEEGKFGVAAPAVSHLAEQIDTMMNLRLRGIMTMAPSSENPEDSRPTFARTAEIFEELQREGTGGGHCNILSMGMSNDFEIAIAYGANLIRIGRALFGEETHT